MVCVSESHNSLPRFNQSEIFRNYEGFTLLMNKRSNLNILIILTKRISNQSIDKITEYGRNLNLNDLKQTKSFFNLCSSLWQAYYFSLAILVNL